MLALKTSLEVAEFPREYRQNRADEQGPDSSQ
jgi:hypothetical protein